MKKKNINDQILKDYFFIRIHQPYLAKSLHDSDESKNDQIIKHINNGLIELRNSINSNS